MGTCELIPSIAATFVPATGPGSVSGLKAWYSFDDITTLWKDTSRTSAVTADADVIKGVTDKSGQGNHLSEGTNGPAYKTAIQNGLSVARFDGVNDRLAKASFPGASTVRTFFIVAIHQSSTINDGMWSFYDPRTGMGSASSPATSTIWVQNNASANQAMYTLNNAWHIAVVRVNSAASLDWWKNGGAAANFDPHDNVVLASNASLFLGLNSHVAAFGQYDFGAFLYYEAALSLTDINTVGNYLGTQWGITWTTAT